MPEKSRLMPISYYNPKQEIRLSAYADTIVLEPDGREQHLRAIRFGGYPEMVRAMSDAIYAGATLETEFAGETAMLTCEPKKYECHLSHDGIYAEATILSLDDADTAAKKDEDAQADGQTYVELPPRKCILFCPAGDRQALFEALDRKTAVPLISEFQDYVLDELQRRRLLKPLRVISIRERLEAWLLLCKKDDANIVKVLEDGLKTGAIHIPGTVQNPNGFDSVHSVTSYLYAFGVTVAERIRNQFQPLFDPAAEQLSPEILRINDFIHAHAGYSLYPAQLAVAESVKRKLSEGKSAFIVAECGSGKTKIGATALAAYQSQKRKKTELQRRRFLKPLRVISIRERLEAWLLLCKKDDANIVKVLEDGLKTGAIHIPGTVQSPNGFDSVHSVTSYLSAFGVIVAERIRNQFQPLFDPAAEQLSPEILHINDYIREHAGYSLYPAQLAVAESVKRKLSEGKSAFIVAECGSGKTKIGATALAAYQAQKRKKTFNIILCPSHVAKKWVRELAETLPDTAGVIVRSITELDSLYAQYQQGNKSIYAVISKEKARDGYMRRPAVLFDARKGAFRCPGCGSVIELPSSDDTYDWVTAKPEAFRMENRRNHQCMNCDKSLVDGGKSKRAFSVGQDSGIRLGASEAGSPCHAEDEEPCRAGCVAVASREPGRVFPDARRVPAVSAQLVHQEAVPRQARRPHRG